MLLQIQPNNWSCLPTAFASIVEVPIGKFIKLTGHDGSEKMWPNLAPPRCYRGWHIQELIEVTLDNFGYAITTLEWLLASKPVVGVSAFEQYHRDYFTRTVAASTGIVAATTYNGNPHAVIFEKGRFYDTRLGKEIDRGHFTLGDILWRFDKINL